MAQKEEDSQSGQKIDLSWKAGETRTLPMLPLRNIVVFPHMIVPLFVGRESSVKALEAVEKGDKTLVLVAQKDGENNAPKEKDLYTYGTVASLLQLIKMPDGTLKVLVEGHARVQVKSMDMAAPFFQATVGLVKEVLPKEQAVRPIMQAAIKQFENFASLNKKIPDNVMASIERIKDASKLTDAFASHLPLEPAKQQELLEMFHVEKRLEAIMKIIMGEVDSLHVEKKIRKRIRGQIEKTQREYYLNEQLKAIQKELGEGESEKDDLDEIAEKISTTPLSEEARTKAEVELRKLRRTSSMSAESSVMRNYLDWILCLPWQRKKRVRKDLVLAEKTLNEDHYGLAKVKERILEYLAVQQRVNKLKGPILCLVGPPGVGKTSLGKSIARATGRELVRMSLGGVRDEAEVRGHRRTYIGSLPGKIIQSMKKVKYSNPLFLLDEIDKLGADFRGDPSAALLEVLDPEQNSAFVDHYLELDYDLSNVMFITTANTLDLPPALLDRMEIIRLAGYTEDEKIEIAQRHLMPKIMKSHGIKKGEFSVSQDALYKIIRLYAREAGVRNLEREVSRLARKVVRKLLSSKVKSVAITPANLENYLGVPKYRYGETEGENRVGVVTGLAWTEVGGELLTVEAVMVPGKGKIHATGKLGDVMKESVDAASSYVRSRSAHFGIEPPLFERKDIHVHVPEGATPKDGPSAGVAMVSAIVSVMTGIKVRHNVAMTGEITLRGRVLAIGGLKEKLLAALRGGIKTVIIPQDNVKDLIEIPQNVKKGLKIVAVDTIGKALDIALAKKPVAIKWDEVAYMARQMPINKTPSPPTH